MTIASALLSLFGMFAPSPPPIATRALDAASGGGKRFRGASTPSIQANANGLAARIGSRARYAQFNQPVVGSAGRAWIANLVGCGLRPSPNSGSADLDAAIMESWEQWTDRADFRGQQGFYGIEKTLAERQFFDGES
jgi:capsid protein